VKIDSHQHFWNYYPEDYSWITDDMAVIRRDFEPNDLKAAAQPCGIEGSVVVQASQSLGETNGLLDLAANDSFIKGVVGWVPLIEEDIEDTLDSFAPRPALKGVRHVLQGQDLSFLQGPAFNRGIRALTARDLTYDILIFSTQLAETIAFVDLHPTQRFILDHIAKPTIEGPPSADWVNQINVLAQRQNVACKFSGLVSRVRLDSWTPELLRPYFDVVLSAFGSDRLMFGSDWPVCLVQTEYDRWVRFVESCAGSLSPAESAQILGGSATNWYQL
jgi:L-fuconolactonase